MGGGQTETSAFDPTLSRVINDLHEGAMQVPAGEFQRWALRQLRPVLEARGWSWGIGCESRDRVHAGLTVAGPDAVDAPGTLAGRPLRAILSARALAEPGVACLVQRSRVAAQACAAMPRPASRLEIGLRESLSGLFAFMACERGPGQRPFSPADCRLLELLAPHLFSAWRNARLATLHAYLLQHRARSAAVVDRLGVVHVAESRFFSLLRMAWPGWSGACLPEPLLPLLVSAGGRVVGGVRWWATPLAGDDAIAFAGTPAGALQRLTPGESRVAVRILEGHSYGEAAAALGISVHTVRNALARAYRKLGVCNKVELLRRLEEG